MARNRYYYYDHETCSFVEVEPKRTNLYAQVGAWVIAALALAGAFTWGLDRLGETPQELALEAENEALRQHLESVEQRMTAFSDQLVELSEADQDLYRTLLQAEPISEDVRQVGVGGADPYESFSRYSPSAEALLRETAQQLDQLERQVGLQNASYRELTTLVGEQERWLAEMPAILPADGPVVSSYGMRMHPILKVRRPHYGIDILVSRGTPVVSPGDGVIKDAGTSASFGKYVKVHHPTTGYTTLYAHLSRIPDDIRRGRKVKRGELIAYSGNTGLSRAPHLHYEVHDEAGKAHNPIYFFAPSMTPSKYKALLESSENLEGSLD
jgi:murein DD-endopeptidase MepM/ murein hydrolase activator NlpD